MSLKHDDMEVRFVASPLSKLTLFVLLSQQQLLTVTMTFPCSSARHAMVDFLEGNDARLKHKAMEYKVHSKGYSMISFIREPSDRFYSSYDEAFFR